MKSLSALFGPPGFDSSARATVFREVFRELTAPQIEALLASFSAGTIQEEDATLLNARHRLNGVLRSGPLRSVERGGAIIAEMFRCQAPERILVLIAERWKTQGEWT